MALSLRQSFHRWRHQVKLLLQIIEANSCIYAVPIENFVVNELALDYAAIDILFVQNVEHGLEELAIGELGGKVLNLG